MLSRARGASLDSNASYAAAEAEQASKVWPHFAQSDNAGAGHITKSHINPAKQRRVEQKK